MMRDAGAREVHFRIASPPITHPDYLRHRHAGARQAARRHPRSGRHARSSSAPTRWRSCRSTASTAPWASSSAIRRGRSSPTTASPATIRPPSPTRPRTKRSPRQLSLLRRGHLGFRGSHDHMSETPRRPHRARHRRLARHRPRRSRSHWPRPAPMSSRSRAPSAGSRSSTTASRPPAAPPRWCRSTSRTSTASTGSRLALHERYGKLDILVGNAGMLGPLSPLGHVEPKDLGRGAWRSTSPPTGG